MANQEQMAAKPKLGVNTLNVKLATSKQEAIPEINKKASTLNYLILTNEKEEKVIINVGEKTYLSVKKLLEQK